MALEGSLKAIKGFGAPEAGKACARALELCRQLGETPQLFPVLEALTWFHIGRGELRTARDLSEECLCLAQARKAPVFLQAAHFAMGEVLHDLGELPQSRKHSEQAITLNDPVSLRSRRLNDFDDIGTSCLVLASATLWALGYPDEALSRIREALELANHLSHPLTQAIAFYGATELYLRRRELQASQEQAEILITLCHEHGFSLWQALGVSLRGCVLAGQKEEEGISEIRQGLAAIHATGVDLWQPYCFALLAEAYEQAGQPEEGLTAIAEAFDLVSRTGSAVNEPGLYRVKGELLLRLHDSDIPTSRTRLIGSASLGVVLKAGEAERCFRRAIEVARKQSAKSWELRATTSLARLLNQQQRHDEARRMLAEIYNWFTQGLDTPDLKEAKALLDGLAV